MACMRMAAHALCGLPAVRAAAAARRWARRLCPAPATAPLPPLLSAVKQGACARAQTGKTCRPPPSLLNIT